MSSTLTVKPIVEVKGLSLSHELKFILRKSIYNSDGKSVNLTINNADVVFLSYLNGLRDAGVESTGELIDFILKHKNVHLMEEI